ncbi:uncharacterized protein SAPINGB_P002436 [Magnusiomyces paraingens]|uniref:Mitochondrial inner membrane protease ATP23 n=1 Tax=Magnusiomyces paraingens TaxID=2606893 RepID=A0A5E8BDW8_9ASCO|nr:uncharacterized protein SAPINGB_P002436 [Saprochaete ingens]VVT49773.1 unnamed protein product [Saprochaete ingens]
MNQDQQSFFASWSKKFSYLAGSMSPQEEEAFKTQLELEKTQRECTRCEEYKAWMMAYSPSVRFMMEQIARVGGNISSQNIVCDACDEFKSGGFHPELGILLCQNRFYSKWHLEDTLTHELVHAYDHCKFDVDWANLRHHACSEIRASSLSGECRMMNQIVKNKIFKFSKGHQDCVRRRATLSVRSNPACKSDEEAAKVVNQVFESCFNDTRPFEEIYR